MVQSMSSLLEMTWVRVRIRWWQLQQQRRWECLSKRYGWGWATRCYPTAGWRGGAGGGRGAYAVVAATAAGALGVPVEKVRVEMGDSLLPDGGLAGGSMMTASLAPAVMQACPDVLKAGHQN